MSCGPQSTPSLDRRVKQTGRTSGAQLKAPKRHDSGTSKSALLAPSTGCGQLAWRRREIVQSPVDNLCRSLRHGAPFVSAVGQSIPHASQILLTCSQLNQSNDVPRGLQRGSWPPSPLLFPPITNSPYDIWRIRTYSANIGRHRHPARRSSLTGWGSQPQCR